MSKTLGKAAVLSIFALKLAVAQDTEVPNDPIPKPEREGSIPVSIRYSSFFARLLIVSADGNARDGCVKLARIWEERRGKAPLYAINSASSNISDSATGT